MYEDRQFDKQFSARLSQLRMNKGVSAREMSLDIGQNPAYINNIETGKSFPSFMGFLYICEYLQITPEAFFDITDPNPDQIIRIIDNLKHMHREQLDHIEAITHDLAEKNQPK